MGAIWFLFFQRQMVVFWMQRCLHLQKQWCETKPLFAEIAVHYCGEMVTGGSSTSGKLESGDSESLSSAHLLTNHGTAAAPGPGSRAHRPHPLYNRRPGSGAPVQCRCSYWQHRSGHQHHLGGDKYFLMVQIFSECGVLGWPQQLDTPLQYHAHQ